MAKFYIGIVAEKGAGKSFFVRVVRKLLGQKNIVSIRFSEPMREILAILGKEETRENMQILTTALREGFKDDGVLNPAVKKRIQGLEADIVILDGVRKKEEARMVKDLGGVLVFITAEQKLRFERRLNDPENKDEEKMNWEQFVKQDLAQTEVSIREVGEKMADVKIENNGIVEEFEEKIKEFLKNHLKN